MIDQLRNGIPARKFDGRLKPAPTGAGKTVYPDNMYDLQTTRLIWRRELCKIRGEQMPKDLKKKLNHRLKMAEKVVVVG